MTKISSTHPPSKPLERKQGSPHCIFWIAAYRRQSHHLYRYQCYFFQHTKVNISVCLVGLSPTTYRATRLIVIDRSLQIGVIAFGYASTPFNFVVE